MLSTDSFRLCSECDGRTHRLTPIGELDLATAPILEHEFDAIQRGADRIIVVDLTEVSFIDSTGLHALLRMDAACEGTDRLRVINGSAAVERLLDIAGVRDRLPIISKNSNPLAPLWRRRTPGVGA